MSLTEISDDEVKTILRNGIGEVEVERSTENGDLLVSFTDQLRIVHGRIRIPMQIFTGLASGSDPHTFTRRYVEPYLRARELLMPWEFQHGMAMTTAAVSAVSFDLNGEGIVRLDATEEPDDSDATVLGRFDRQSRLHSVDGKPGLEYSDGRAEFYWHGVKVPIHVVRNPELITAEEIDNEVNVETRRVMIERYPGGAIALMQAQGAILKHKDETGELWARDHRPGRSQWRGDNDDLIMLKVKNSSPEPDGTFKDYWLRVPPTMRTAKEAVAWTFGLTASQYQPELET